jgi:glycosyltransferase involved in cell wall biosynthesis
MRVAHIAPSARSQMSAAWRIRKAQENAGIDAYALVHQGVSNPNTKLFRDFRGISIFLNRWAVRLDSVPVRICSERQRELPWSAGLVGLRVANQINAQSPDIVNLHWATSGWFSLRDLSRVGCPVVFTCHDVWPVTAGCHCNLGCEKWKQQCVECPQLGQGPLGLDVSKLLWQAKKKSYSSFRNISVVTPSKWLGKMASESEFFGGRRIEVIPNCLDMTVFKPASKFEIREKLKLPQKKKIILFGAINALHTSYKGFQSLIEILDLLKARKPKHDYHLVVFGSTETNVPLPFATTFLGTLNRESEIAQVYQAADLFVTPSQQDNFPNTVLEAISTGVPTVAFEVGGIPEMVKHKEHGYIAKAFDTSDFADGIEWCIESEDRLRLLGEKAREYSAKSFSPEIISKRYLDLYSELLSERRNS